MNPTTMPAGNLVSAGCAPFEGRAMNALLIFAGAAGLFLGHAGAWGQIPALVLLAPFCIFLLAVGAATPGRAFCRSWLCGTLGYSAALYWIAVPVTEVGGLPMIAAVPLVILLGAYLGLFSGLAGLAAWSLQRFFAGRKAGLLWAGLICGPAFAGLEVLCGFLFTGFPWLVPAAAFVPLPDWIQAAALVGAYGLGGIYCAGACLCAAAGLEAGRRRLAPLLLGLLLIVAPPVYGHLRLVDWKEDPGPAVNIGLVQGNVDQNQKWEPVFQSRTIAHYLQLSQNLIDEAAARGERPVAVFWPETAMPFYFAYEPDKADILRGFALRNAVDLGFGTVGARRDEKGRLQLYNRFQVVGPDGGDVGYYDKQHLVPFGEYVPLNLDLAFVSAMLQGVPFAPGRVHGPLRLPLDDPTADAPRAENPGGTPPLLTSGARFPKRELALGVLICYEAIFPEYAQARVTRGAQVLLNISNDAWFGRTSSPLQHLHLAALRAVEQGRPLVRVTNTGYSAVIDAAGRIGKPRSGLFTDDAFVVAVHPRAEPTLYHRLHGYVEDFLLAAAALALFLHPVTRRFRRPGSYATAL